LSLSSLGLVLGGALFLGVGTASAATTCFTSNSATCALNSSCTINTNCTFDPSDGSGGSYSFTSFTVNSGRIVTAGSHAAGASGAVYIYASNSIDIEGTLTAVGMNYTGAVGDGGHGGAAENGSITNIYGDPKARAPVVPAFMAAVPSVLALRTPAL
jgi:hypothetical protein